jgi:predicted nucleotidyltransferase
MISVMDKKLIIRFAKQYQLTKVILFGSSLEQKEAYDIDIAVKGIKPDQFYDFSWDLFKNLSKPVDIIDLEISNQFNALIERDGLKIYG